MDVAQRLLPASELPMTSESGPSWLVLVMSSPCIIRTSLTRIQSAKVPNVTALKPRNLPWASDLRVE